MQKAGCALLSRPTALIFQEVAEMNGIFNDILVSYAYPDKIAPRLFLQERIQVLINYVCYLC